MASGRSSKGRDLSLAPGTASGSWARNGAGKSTLIKVLAGELAPRRRAPGLAQELRIGYFAQHQMDQLRPDDSPLRHLQRLDPKATEQALRNYLGGFDFDRGSRPGARGAPVRGREGPPGPGPADLPAAQPACCWTSPPITWTWRCARP